MVTFFDYCHFISYFLIYKKIIKILSKLFFIFYEKSDVTFIFLNDTTGRVSYATKSRIGI